ncbi:MAG: guanylate kinase [Holosporaceae bacterium]|jgi:guanylate kinase|nr:guanylate kinase [Holosporaceae bacterium]
MGNGILIIISGPSAVGKTSVTEAILAMDPRISRIITTTTRKMRSSEKPGVDYYFISHGEFTTQIALDKFAEYAEVYGNYYGVWRREVDEKSRSGKCALLTMNPDGFFQLRRTMANGVGFFLLPPTMKDLELRMRKRNTDSEETIQRRIKMAEHEICQSKDFDYRIENHDVATTAAQILKITGKLLMNREHF